MSRDEVILWLLLRDYKPDAWGNYKKPGIERRYKLTKLGVRLEVKAAHGAWLRVRSGYYSKLFLNGEGKLGGMTR